MGQRRCCAPSLRVPCQRIEVNQAAGHRNLDHREEVSRSNFARPAYLQAAAENLVLRLTRAEGEDRGGIDILGAVEKGHCLDGTVRVRPNSVRPAIQYGHHVAWFHRYSV